MFALHAAGAVAGVRLAAAPLAARRSVAHVAPLAARPARVCSGCVSVAPVARMHGLAKFITAVEKEQIKTDLPTLKIGAQVKVGVTVTEGNKTRVQPYVGMIIAQHKNGLSSTITVRKIFQGVGVERVFPIHSPLVKIELVVTAGVPRVRTAEKATASTRSPRPAPRPAAARGAPADLSGRVLALPATSALRRYQRVRVLAREASGLGLRALQVLTRRWCLCQVRRAKLYYLRDRVGKAARLKVSFVSQTKKEKEADASAASAASAAAAAAAARPAPEPVAA